MTDKMKRLEDIVLKGVYVTDEEVKVYEGLENKEDYVDKYWKLENRFKNLRDFFDEDSVDFVGYGEGKIRKVLEVYDRLKKDEGKSFKNEKVRSDYEELMKSVEGYLKGSCMCYNYNLNLGREAGGEVQGLVDTLNFKDKKYWQVKERIFAVEEKIKGMKEREVSLRTVDDLYLLSEEVEKLAKGKLSKYEWELGRLKREVDGLMKLKSEKLNISMGYLKMDKMLQRKEISLMEETLEEVMDSLGEVRDELYGVARLRDELCGVARRFLCFKSEFKGGNFPDLEFIDGRINGLVERELGLMRKMFGNEEIKKKIGQVFLKTLSRKMESVYGKMVPLGEDLSEVARSLTYQEREELGRKVWEVVKGDVPEGVSGRYIRETVSKASDELNKMMGEDYFVYFPNGTRARYQKARGLTMRKARELFMEHLELTGKMVAAKISVSDEIKKKRKKMVVKLGRAYRDRSGRDSAFMNLMKCVNG